VLDRATRLITVSSSRLAFGGVAYEYANLVLHGMACSRARELGTELVALAVWDGRPGNGAGGTSSVVARWRSMGVPLYQVDLSTLPAAGETVPVVRDSPGERSLAPAPVAEPNTSVMVMLFADAADFSKLTEGQVPAFVEHVVGAVADLASEFVDICYGHPGVLDRAHAHAVKILGQ
jgi:hypothetical protein